MTDLKIFMTAGEESGDSLGVHLMRSLREKSQRDIHFSGIGGAAMIDEGLKTIFPMQDLSVMGIMEVLPRLGLILKRIGQTADQIIETKPDIIITIDAPDFSFRVIKKVKEHYKSRRLPMPPILHYVAPTVWAWRPERAQKIAVLYDGVMCLFPFEPPYFEKEGMKAAFVGHPVMGDDLTKADGHAFRKVHDIPTDADILGVLFGSRIGELNRTGPALREAVYRWAGDNPQGYVVAPTLPHLQREVKNMLQEMPCQTRIIPDRSEKWHSFAAMNKAIAVSGTVGLELAVAGVPHVIGYKMNTLTWHLAKRKFITQYAHLANILLDKLVVPEFIQGNCNADNLYQALDGMDVDTQSAAFEHVRNMLGNPSQSAAEFVLSLT